MSSSSGLWRLPTVSARPELRAHAMSTRGRPAPLLMASGSSRVGEALEALASVHRPAVREGGGSASPEAPDNCAKNQGYKH